MNDKGQVQKELFEEFADTGKKRPFKSTIYPNIKRSFNLSYEQIIFIAIAFVIGCVLFYVLGVEKSKRSKPISKDITPVEEKTEAVSAYIYKDSKEKLAVEAATETKKTITEPKVQKNVQQGPIYTVRVATYIKEPAATKESDLLRSKGLDSFVHQSGKYYVVCIGRFAEEAKAKSEQKKLLKIYPDCYVKQQ